MESLIVGVGGILIAGLTYFAGIQRGVQLERRTVKREEERGADDAREVRIAEVVSRYFTLRNDTGAGASLMTVRDAGIAALKNDAEMREAIDRMAAMGPDPMQEFRPLLAELDLPEVFAYSLAHQVPVDRGIEAAFRRLKEGEA